MLVIGVSKNVLYVDVIWRVLDPLSDVPLCLQTYSLYDGFEMLDLLL